MKLDATLTTGLTDLGRERKRYESCCCPDTGKSESKEKTYISYPSFTVVGKDELLDAPEEEFYAVVKLKKGNFAKRTDWDDPEKKIAEVDFEVVGIKALSSPKKVEILDKVELDFSGLDEDADTD